MSDCFNSYRVALKNAVQVVCDFCSWFNLLFHSHVNQHHVSFLLCIYIT